MTEMGHFNGPLLEAAEKRGYNKSQNGRCQEGLNEDVEYEVERDKERATKV